MSSLRRSWTAVCRWLASRRGASEAGASMVEYALLLTFVAAVTVVALVFLGGSLSNSLANSANQFP